MKKLIKEIVFVIICGLSLYGAIRYGTTSLQMLPIVLYATLSILDWYHKQVKIWMLLLSGLMFIANLSIFAVIDMIGWLIVFGLYLK